MENLSEILTYAAEQILRSTSDKAGRTRAALTTQALDALLDAAKYHARTLDAQAIADASSERYNHTQATAAITLAMLRIEQLQLASIPTDWTSIDTATAEECDEDFGYGHGVDVPEE